MAVKLNKTHSAYISLATGHHENVYIGMRVFVFEWSLPARKNRRNSIIQFRIFNCSQTLSLNSNESASNPVFPVFHTHMSLCLLFWPIYLSLNQAVVLLFNGFTFLLVAIYFFTSIKVSAFLLFLLSDCLFLLNLYV